MPLDRGKIIGYTTGGTALYSTGVEGQANANKQTAIEQGDMEQYKYTNPPSATSNQGATDGSARLRNDMATFKDNANSLSKMLGDNSLIDKALSATPYTQTTQGQSELQSIRQQMLNAGVLTPDQEAAVSGAGEAAAAQYTGLINEAEQAKKQGLPKAEIAAGQRGGFMNSQFAGVAAILPTEGGNFRGAGGELERIQSVYDNNIANLKAQRLQAAEAAKSAARQAMITGKREDAKTAKQLFETAKAAHDDAIKLANEKLTIMNNYQSMQQKQLEFSQAQADKTLERLQNSAAVGIAPAPEDKAVLDNLYGTGFSDKYVEAAKAAKTAKTEAEKQDAAIKMLTAVKDIPEGRVINIGGVEFKGEKSADPNNQIFSADDGKGNITYVTIDKNTGNKINEQIVKGIGTVKKVAGSGSGDGKMTDEFKNWFYQSFAKSVVEDPQEAANQWANWQATGKAVELKKQDAENAKEKPGKSEADIRAEIQSMPAADPKTISLWIQSQAFNPTNFGYLKPEEYD